MIEIKSNLALAIFLLNSGFNFKLTGIEHAAIKRLNILSLYDVKILTLNFSNNYKDIVDFHGLSENQHINFFDYHQKFDHISNASCRIKFLENNDFELLDIMSDKVFKLQKNNVILKVFCLFDKNKISTIDYFDHKGFKFKTLIFNKLGFLSKEINYILDGLIVELFFNSNENIFLEVTNNRGDKSYKFYDVGVQIFLSEQELYACWLRKVFKNDDILFIDKNRIYNPILSRLLDINLKKIAIIHSTHTHNPNIDDQKKLNSNYKFLIENQNQFSACVVATESQYKDLITDFKMKIPVFVIPPSYIENYQLNLSLGSDNFRIISIGRIAVEKRHEDMILAMKTIIKAVPNVTLEFFGFGNNELIIKLEQMIIRENLTSHVFFRPYTKNIKKELFNAHLSLVTSKVEGFCIAILDSLEQGTPVAAYNIKYGPSSMIENNVNGFLVEDGNINMLAESIIQYFKSDTSMYLEGTKLILNKYSRECVYNKWNSMINCFL